MFSAPKKGASVTRQPRGLPAQEGPEPTARHQVQPSLPKATAPQSWGDSGEAESADMRFFVESRSRDNPSLVFSHLGHLVADEPGEAAWPSGTAAESVSGERQSAVNILSNIWREG